MFILHNKLQRHYLRITVHDPFAKSTCDMGMNKRQIHVTFVSLIYDIGIPSTSRAPRVYIIHMCGRVLCCVNENVIRSCVKCWLVA